MTTPPPRARWIALGAAGGVVLGVAAALVAPWLLHRTAGKAPATAQRAVPAQGKGPLDVGGKAGTTLRNVSLKDHEDFRVLTIAAGSLQVSLDDVAKNQIRVPSGKVEHVALYLRRGKSGRVSLGEVLANENGPKANAPSLDIGPLEVEDAELTIAFSENPVVIQIDKASVRVQRNPGQPKPRLFLSQIQGHLLKPDPLHQPVAIRGGTGVVDLNGDPLVDMRVRGCIGDSEMRIHVDVAERRQGADLTLDTEGAAAKVAGMALKLVSAFKPEKIRVEIGSVKVSEPGTCSREHGSALRERMDAEEAKKRTAEPNKR